ncbi:hypothetical protein pipiens_015902 [Culex pipiens pipiens]|uniref:Uncharacterized protein n=1 Tax=Culex pipiens pipiens TaxID=38569 RepID=A0ABD1CPI2_CULPP
MIHQEKSPIRRECIGIPAQKMEDGVATHLFAPLPVGSANHPGTYALHREAPGRLDGHIGRGDHSVASEKKKTRNRCSSLIHGTKDAAVAWTNIDTNSKESRLAPREPGDNPHGTERRHNTTTSRQTEDCLLWPCLL